MNGKKLLIAFLFTSWTNYTLAAGSNSGVIHFEGAIVDPPCDVQVEHNQLSSSCYRDGQNLITRSAISGEQAIPASFGQSEMSWLNSEHTQGILTASYN